MVLTLLALTTEAKKAIHFYMKESSSNNHGADYEDKAPVHGGWSEWGICSKSCGGGWKERSCTNPIPLHGGEDCSKDCGSGGSCKSAESCNAFECIDPCQCGIVDVLCKCGLETCSVGQICVNGECLDQCSTSSSGSSKCLCGINTCQPGETCANGKCLENPVCQFGIVDEICQCGLGECSVGQINGNNTCQPGEICENGHCHEKEEDGNGSGSSGGCCSRTCGKGVPGVMLIGGYKNGHMTTQLPMNNSDDRCTWTFPEGRMFSGVYGLAAAMYNTTKIMVCGGWKRGYLKSCHSLDLHKDSAKWELAPELPKRLYYHAMTSIGDSGAVAVTGGRTDLAGDCSECSCASSKSSCGQPAGISNTYRLLPGQNSSWTTGPYMNERRHKHCGVSYDVNSIVVTGGEYLNAKGVQILNTAELINFSTSTSTTLSARMKYQRKEHGCAVIETGQGRGLIVAGGNVAYARLCHNCVELMIMSGEVATWSWQELTSLPVKRHKSPALIPTPDGHGVRIIGGYGEGAKDEKIFELQTFDIKTWIETGVTFPNKGNHFMAAVPLAAC